MLMGEARPRLRERLESSAPLAATGAAWLIGVGTTAAVIGSSHLVFALHSRMSHVVLQTADACVALLVAYLLWGRFWRTRRQQDLALAQGFFLLALAGGLELLVHAAATTDRPGRLELWSALSLRVAAAVLVVVAGLLGRDRHLAPGRRLPLVLPFLLVAAVVVVLWASRDHLATALPHDPPASAADPVISGHPVLLTAQLVGGAAFAVASVLFARQAFRRPDALMMWLGPACAIAAFARLNYFLFPSIYTDWIYTGDFLRTASYALLLVGAVREIGQHWSGWAAASVLEDRRRLARELHDGVVQELGYLRSLTLSEVAAGPAHDDMLAACDRAIDEARAAVDALGRSPSEPLGFVLHRAARQVAERYGGRVLVDLDDSVDVGEARRHALVRITREAVSNAIRHGRARAICIRLERDADACRLVVQDDGLGFDPAAASRSTGFGLTSMRERATALPGSFEVSSAVGRGTSVTVTWRHTPARTGAERVQA
jgi:signal transduction histidine kinase